MGGFQALYSTSIVILGCTLLTFIKWIKIPGVPPKRRFSYTTLTALVPNRASSLDWQWGQIFPKLCSHCRLLNLPATDRATDQHEMSTKGSTEWQSSWDHSRDVAFSSVRSYLTTCSIIRAVQTLIHLRREKNISLGILTSFSPPIESCNSHGPVGWTKYLSPKAAQSSA